MMRGSRLGLVLAFFLVGCPGESEPGETTGATEPAADASGTAGADVTEAPDPGPSEAPDEGTEAPLDPGGTEAEDNGVDATPPPGPCEGGADGEPCDDGEACTSSDACKAGACVGEAYECSDGLGCTKDVCDGAGGCSFPIKGARCLIDGVCWTDGDAPTDLPCVSCVAPVAQTQWTADDTLDCDDDDFCTSGDHCFGGECVPVEVKSCDDGNWCTDDGCTLEGGCTHAPNDRACSDDDPCTVGDTCANATCLPGDTYVTCDDDNNCTDDLCVPEVGCTHEPKSYACDDGNPCTTGDQCVEGACASGPPMVCTDDNPCTDDKCHPDAGCVYPFNTAPCEDGNPCTTGDQCAFGACQIGPIDTVCNDLNPCTQDACDLVGGGCIHPPDNAAPCSDGDACTLGDFCEAGICKAGGVPVNCDDANDCTDDKCGPDGTCQFVPNVLPCDDEDPCTKGDGCEAGVCVSGSETPSCADTNPCTDDACQSGIGCQHTPNSEPCNDGDACTLGDQCTNGQCIAGGNGAACDDGNGCTDDFCAAEKGCVNVPNNALCDDGEPCTTSDQCGAGVCQGDPGDCDDDNECTKEICLAGGGCQHVPINSPECRPKITIINPPRGAMLKGPGPVFVTGSVKVGGAGLKDFFINDFKVETNPTSGAFSYMMTPHQGLNIIQTIATSKQGGEATGVRSFTYSNEYFTNGTMVPQGIGLWLGQMVWDDNNTSDVDDIATVMTLLLQSYDIPGLIPNPLTKAKALHCSFTVNTTYFFIGQPTVDLTPKNQALGVKVRYPNIGIGLDANASGFLCPSISGSIKADYIEVSLDLVIKGDGGSGVDVTMANQKATVAGLDVSLGGILGFLVNWIIDFFEGSIATQIETLVLDQLSIIPETLAGALESLAVSESFEMPKFIGDGPPVTINLTSTLTAADFDQFGGFLELSSSTTATPKGIPYNPIGSVGRANCLDTKPEFFDYLMAAEIEIALKDDMMNQMLFAAWYGGAFEMPLPASFLGDVDLTEYGVVLNDLTVSFMLPPVLSSCNFEENLILGIGDMKVHVSLVLFDQPLEITAFASGEILAELVVQEGLDGNTLGIALDEVILFDVEVEEVSAGFENAQAAVEELIDQFLAPDFLTSFGGEALGGIPIPSIPLDGFTDAVPKGTELTLDLKKVYRLGGRSVMAGNAK